MQHSYESLDRPGGFSRVRLLAPLAHRDYRRLVSGMSISLLAAGASPVTSGLASAVLSLGETFQLEVVAEGIEYEEQIETLQDLGCELGQGFLFAKPMPHAALVRYLAQTLVRDDVRGEHVA